MNVTEIFNEVDDFVNSDKCCGIGEKGSWADFDGVIRERNGTLVVFIKKSGYWAYFDEEEVAFMEDNNWWYSSTLPISLGSKRQACYVIEYSAMKAQVKASTLTKAKEGVLTKNLRMAKKEIEILTKDMSKNETTDQLVKEIKSALLDSGISRLSSPFINSAVSDDKCLAGTPTLFLSDWHWAEVVDPKQIENLNKYNIDIGMKRSERVFSKSLNLLFHHLSGQTYDRAVIPLGGDMLSGNIHEELQRTNETPMADAVRSLAIELARGIREYAKNFKTVYVPCVVGNHGRFEKKPTAKGKAKDNFDYMVYTFIHALVADLPNVKIDISEATDIRFDIYKTRYLLTHGDQIKGGAGIGGIWPSMMKTDQRKRKRHQISGGGYDYLMCGHFHHYGMIDNIIVNGSLKGYDEYAYGGNFDFEPPQQAMWITHPQHGITQVMPIFCG